MKLLKTVLSSVVTAVVLSSCHGDILESSTKTVNVDDVALSDMPGYALHGVYIYRQNSVVPDRVYFVIKDGKPVEGATATYQSGKKQTSVTSVVTPDNGSAMTAKISCSDEADCAARVAAANAVKRPTAAQ
jgi:hypothetical protein